VALVPEYPQENERYDAGQPVLLVTVTEESEAMRLEALLTSYHIPVLKKHEAAGGAVNVIMGNSSFGVELYVPELLVKKALTILQRDDNDDLAGGDETIGDIFDTEDETFDDDEMDEAEETEQEIQARPLLNGDVMDEEGNKRKRGQRIRAWIILLVLIPGLLWLVIGVLWPLVFRLFGN
jgi:hypothetical protein